MATLATMGGADHVGGAFFTRVPVSYHFRQAYHINGDGKMYEAIFTWLACAAAFVSGALWLRSAAVQVPEMTYESIEPEGSFAWALSKQAALNKWAAAAASVAALLQGVSLAVKGH
jgi:hypothetical protein